MRASVLIGVHGDPDILGRGRVTRESIVGRKAALL